MPYKSEKIPIHHTKHDRRIKLTDEDKERIKKLGGELSQRALARMFDVSRQTIRFILFPDKLARNKELRKARGGWRLYYDREKNAETIKEHRRYKQKLKLKGEI